MKIDPYYQWQKTAPGLDFSDVQIVHKLGECPVTFISRSRYLSTSNISKNVQDRAILTMAD